MKDLHKVLMAGNAPHYRLVLYTAFQIESIKLGRVDGSYSNRFDECFGIMYRSVAAFPPYQDLGSYDLIGSVQRLTNDIQLFIQVHMRQVP